MSLLPEVSSTDARGSRPDAKNFKWFCELTPSLLAEYKLSCTVITLAAGGVLFAEDQMPQCVSVICEGRVKLTRSSREGKTLLVKIAKPGDVLGLSAALSHSSHEVTARAMEPARLKSFAQGSFLRFLEGHAESSLWVAESLSNEYRSMLSDTCRMALSDSIAARVAHLLLGLTVEGGLAESRQPEIHLSMKHEDIASMLGSSRESITRVLNSFKRKAIVEIHGTRVRILRREVLESLI